MPDLHELLSAASSTVVVDPPGADAAVATARTRKRRRTGAVALALVAALTGAAGSVSLLNGDSDREAVVPTAGEDIADPVAQEFPALAAGEEVAKLFNPAVLAGGASITAYYSAVTCTRERRWDLLESATEVRARLVVTGAPRPRLPGCVGQAPTRRESVVQFTAPVAGRRLVVMSGLYELVVREAVTPTPSALTPTDLPSTPPAFSSLGARELVSEITGLRTSGDGRELVASAKDCLYGARLEVAEGADEVRVRLVVRQSNSLATCSGGILTGQLVASVSDRRVVLVARDNTREITPFDGRALLEPTLPSGFLEQPSEGGVISAGGTTWSRSWRDPRMCAPGPSSVLLTQGPSTDIVMRVTNWQVVGQRDVNGIPAELRRGNTGEYVLLWSTPQGPVGLTEGRVTTKGCSHFLTEDSLLKLARGLRPS